jgi:hypothetical protein
MIPAAPREDVLILPDEPWATRYEEMRQQVMARSRAIDHTYGYALLVRRGLVAWMKAWPRPAPESSCDPGFGHTVDGVTVSSHLLRSAASLLVNMILTLGAPTEVPHEQ